MCLLFQSFGTNSHKVISSNENLKPTDEHYYRSMADRKLFKLKMLQNMKMSIQETGNINIAHTLTEIDQLIDLSEIWAKATTRKEKSDAMPNTLILIVCPLILCIYCLQEEQLNEINRSKYNYLRANKDLLIQQLRNEVNMYSNQQLEEHISLLTKAINQTDFNELIAATITTNASETMQAMQGMQAIQAMMMNNGMNGGMNGGMMMNNGMNIQSMNQGYDGDNIQTMNR